MTEVVFVGTSDAFGAGGRRQSAVCVRAPEGTVLLDCGTTTATGLADLGITRDEIDVIAISHYHGDHFGGIPQLLLACLYEDRRARPILIAGPGDVEARVRRAASSLGFELEGRDWTFPIEFQELQPGSTNSLGPMKARIFETYHQKDVHPHGLSVEIDRRRMVFSGDTGWFDGLADQVGGADLFICECTFLEAGYPFHLSLEELSVRARDFECERLVLTHLGRDMARRRGSCDLETADDGLVIRL